MKIALAQINPIIGDIIYNKEKIISYIDQAENEGADLVIFPELSLCGYPPKDLLLRKDFLRAQELALGEITQAISINAILGAAILGENNSKPYNAAVLCSEGQWHLIAKKTLLPNYNVFDEKRYFIVNESHECHIVKLNNKILLITICEDAWASLPSLCEASYDFDPIEQAINKHHVDYIINMSASPFSINKPSIRKSIFTHLAKKYKKPVLMVGQVGANDQLMFDGNSLIINDKGIVISKATSCEEEIIYTHKAKILTADNDGNELLIEVITMGIKDYIAKCGSLGVIIGLSGGIDSAVLAALAVKALGRGRVRLFFLPSRFNSIESLNDASRLAENLAIKLEIIPMESTLDNLRELIGDKSLSLSDRHMDIVDQNLQSRLRGLVLMAISNASDYFMLTTANKSELAVGYATIYGDLCGAFSPLGDIYKTQIYDIAYLLNKKANQELIPISIIHKPPSAELKMNQLDSENLPEYSILDKILFNFIELEKSSLEIAHELMLEQSLVDDIISMVHRSEYKRRQSPMTFMVSDKVFGDARRLPIAKRMRLGIL